MNTTTQKNTYSDFTPRQVLSAADLNKNFEYLQDQDLLTRANLIGTGIVSGLDVSFTNDSVTISKGCGITSGGYYIYIDNDLTYSFYSNEAEHTCQKSESSGNKARAFKLFGSGSGSEYIRITESFLRDKNVVLFCNTKKYEQPCGSCNSGSTKGNEVAIDIYALLVSNAVFSERGSLFAANSSAVSLPVLKKVPRLVSLVNDQKVIINNLSIELSGSIQLAYSIISAIRNVTRQRADFEKIKIGLRSATWNDYNFLCDLTEAYEEFRQCGEKVLLDYRLSAEEFPFPCYLILGDKDKKYRHHFRPATASDDYAELNRLWERIVTMIEYFNPDIFETPAVTNIRLTPSVYGAVPLSEKAVPYYYKKTDGTPMPYVTWNKHKNPLGYWYEKNENVPDDGYYKGDNWKNYDLEQYNFVRIEGHVGVECNDAKRSIDKEITLHELPIKTIGLHLPIKQESDCISPYQDNAFGLLKINFTDTKFVKGLYGIIFDFLNTEKVDNLTDISEETWSEKIKNVITAANDVKDAANDVKDAANGSILSEKLSIAEKNAGTAQESVLSKKEIFQTALKSLGSDIPQAFAGKINTAKDKAIGLVAKIENAISIITIRSEIAKKENLEEHLKEYVEIKSRYESIALFVKDKEYSQKIISFLHWLDATHTKYQQCKEFSSFIEFKKKHPGLQHKSGVPIGGTFILVYNDDNKVIADFCLPYRVTQPD